MNLVNMLILSKEYSAAENLTTLYEELVLKHLGKDCLDYGVCQLTKGILAYGQGRAKDAELYFLSAESIFQGLLNEDNYYSKTVYRYLYNLYGKCGKLELAAEFRSKLHSNN